MGPSKSEAEKDNGLAAGGGMPARIRGFDWAKTGLGPISAWPESLRSAASICTGSKFPIAIYWGPDLILIYNDAWSPILGEKHPWALGHRAREVWPEIWDTIGPLFEHVVSTGEATRSKDQLLPMKRHGYTEECYFDYTFTPIQGDGAEVQGIFNAVLETTERVIGERRQRILRGLAAGAYEARNRLDACRLAAGVLEKEGADVPLALFYLLSEDGSAAHLAADSGFGAAALRPPEIVEIPGESNTGDELIQSIRHVALTDKSAQLDLSSLDPPPEGPWPEPTERAVVLPLIRSGHAQPHGVIVAGVSPRRALDAEYKGFFDLVAGQITQAIGNANEYEQERKRTEELAALDRAKTTFFSNVSHEFRTPLTLMLGPLEGLLANASTRFAPEDVDDIATVHRNSVRLLKLVNTLLDFSRIEAGRMQASYEPVDLSAFTADLASVFRSAIERAKLKLIIDADALPGEVYVDREMWEKIVLNLLSNAFKFTFEGVIEVRLEALEGQAQLTVSDTGVGIPAEQIPRMFDRFHRVEHSRGRSHEGSGIGLSLVEELVKLHGGTVRVESEIDRGSRFIVSIPLGKAHLPAERIRTARTMSSTALQAEAFVAEAVRWLPSEGGLASDEQTADRPLIESLGSEAGRSELRGRIVLADDNADMRDYVRRLLAGAGFEVEAVGDGQAALEAARRHPPDLVLSDVMMPRLDGFELLSQLRTKPDTADIPILLLSARAREESRVEGMQLGADDYILKPFSARELLARVESHVKMARLRRQATESIRARERELSDFFETASIGLHWVGPDGIILRANQAELDMLGYSAEEYIGRQIGEFHVDEPVIADILARLTRGERLNEYPARLRCKDGSVRDVLINSSVLFENGEFIHTRCFTTDVSERKRAEAARRASEERFRMVADNIDQLAWTCDSLGYVTWYNRRWLEYTGLSFEEMKAWGWTRVHHPDHVDRVVANIARSRESGEIWEDTFPLRGKDGEYRWFLSRAVPIRNEAGDVLRWFGTNTDITEQRLLQESLREADRRKDEFLATLAHELRNPLAPISTGLEVMKTLSDDRAALEKIRGVLERQTQQLVILVNDLMEVSRISRGKLELRKQRVNMAAVIQSALEAVEPTISEAGHELIVNLPEKPIELEADPHRLAQVVSNVLDNAAKYTPNGGRIWLKVERRGDQLVLTIKDTGTGIAAERLKSIFDMFAQIKHPLHKDHGGLGIGLTLVKSLVEMHGGRIEVRSEGPGKGSEFTISLPLSTESLIENLKPLAVLSRERAKSYRVLVVDDHKEAAELLGMVVNTLGHEARIAEDGEQALAAAAAFLPDVVLMDLGMPRMDGYEAARHMRRQPWGQKIALVALTGWGQEEDRNRTREAGFDHHLVKPATTPHLMKLFANLEERLGLISD